MRYLEKCADVEAESDLPGRLVGRSREARNNRSVEAAQPGLCCLGVDRGLST